MPATVQDVRDLDLVSGFECFTKGTIEKVIIKAELFICEAAWDRGADQPGRGACAIALLAAHFLASAPKGRNSGGAVPSGPVTAQSAGGISRSYGTAGGVSSESAFGSTSYGQQYLELRSVIVTTPLTAANC
jgi:hypothetical protein